MTEKHERRVVGHASGWQEQMNTCVCGKPWPCNGEPALLTSKTIADPFTPAQNKAYDLYLELGGIVHMLGNEEDIESAIQNLEAIMERLHGEFT